MTALWLQKKILKNTLSELLGVAFFRVLLPFALGLAYSLTSFLFAELA
jgi:hypothetical protein